MTANVPLADLTHGSLGRIGASLCRAYPAVETRDFNDVLTAIDAADEKLHCTPARRALDRPPPANS